MIINFEEIRQGINDGTYPILGSGSGRKVFDLRNGYVVKVAINQKGFAQNEMEYSISREYISIIMAKVLVCSNDYMYLIMEKAERINSLSEITSYYKARNFNDILNCDDVKILLNRYDLVGTDLQRKSSWGIVYGRPVIIDFGFTKQIRAKYYGLFK